MTVDERLAAGWRPAATIPRLWVLGQNLVLDEDRDIVAETWDAEEPMSEADEQELITMVWSGR